MKCIFCNYSDSKVLDSRYMEDNNTIRRRRECLKPKCLKCFNTYERVETVPILVIKTDNSRQQFNPNKIKQGILKACEKRPISMNQIDEVVNDIEKQIQNSLKQEVKSSEIGEMIMEKLRELDEVAYIRFASVYRKFTDVTHFVDFIKSFEKMLENDKNE